MRKRKQSSAERCILCGARVLSFGDFAAAQAGRADANALPLTVDLRVHRTQIDVPAPLGDVMSVADAVSRLRLLAADITLLCHDYSRINKNKEEFRSCGTNLNFTRILPNREMTHIEPDPPLRADPIKRLCRDSRPRLSAERSPAPSGEQYHCLRRNSSRFLTGRKWTSTSLTLKLFSPSMRYLLHAVSAPSA